MKVELVTKTKGVGKYEGLSSEEIISAIARHGTIKEDNGRLVKYLMDHKHWSPLEFLNFTFEIETSRAIGRQILRHRSMSGIQEWSQRYSESAMFEDFELRKEHPTNRQSSTEVFNPSMWKREGDQNVAMEVSAKYTIKTLLKDVENIYKELLRVGVAKECARMILPECTTTIMTFNGTLRTWLSFLNVRMEEHSQKEVVDIATLIGEELESQLPNVFKQIDWRNGLFM